ncbi:MAG: ATP-dependent RNA helicase, partial [Tepidisphaeraceae bacterium]
AEPVSRFLGDCPVVVVEGRAFPIAVEYIHGHATAMSDQISAAIEKLLCESKSGDVLVFLPGAPEIRRAMRELEPLARQHDLLVVPLHGSLAAHEQLRALQPARQREVILATNIAETSLTIDGVRFVIDSGTARIAGFDPSRGIDRLDLRPISQASAIQRAGRSGRTGPGRCIRLYSEKDFHARAAFEAPEIRRVDLSGTVLALHSWGVRDPEKFGWFDPPPHAAIESAERMLAMLGALDARADSRITQLGRRMLELPVHPRLARMLLAGADAGMSRHVAGIAAMLSERDFARDDESDAPQTRASSDLLVRLPLLDAENPSTDVDVSALRQIRRVRDQLFRMLPSASPRAADESDLLRAVLLAYPDRVARRRGAGPGALMVGGTGVRLDRRSVVQDWEFFVAADARHDPRGESAEAVVRLASGIEAQWLSELFSDAIRSEQRTTFDEKSGRVTTVRVTLYRDLVIREDRGTPVDSSDVERALADAVRARAAEIFSSNATAAQLIKRVALLRQWMPEHGWPSFDDVELGELLSEISVGKRSIDEVARADLAGSLRARLPYPLDRLLEEHAPQSVEVPSGSRISVDYSGASPVLAVRIQEIFGWSESPRLAGGRVPLLLHLLAPNYRAVQITNDLKSFWSTTYFQVRKDLRVRYSKHAWPENPLTARPQAKGARRR